MKKCDAIRDLFRYGRFYAIRHDPYASKTVNNHAVSYDHISP